MSLRHGHARKSGSSPTYKSWESMKWRCNNTNHPKYRYYGGRGIKVCDRWMKFDNFLSDMGERQPNTTLDRINNDGHYEPGNCRWATRDEQTQNSKFSRFRKGRVVEFRGQYVAIADLAKRSAAGKCNFYNRLKSGWTIEEALNVPKSGKRRPQG